MNEVLQRRLIGALVLLALAFLVASLLPDARPLPSPEGVRVVTYDLGNGLPVEPSATEPAPAPAPASETVPAPAPPRTALQLQESLALDMDGSWHVQVGSFESQANARAVRVKLYQAGLPTTVQPVQVGKVLWYRVRVGPYAAEPPAHKALLEIRRQGYEGARLVRPGTP